MAPILTAIMEGKLPQEIVIAIMELMISPTDLLSFLIAFPSLRDLFIIYHSQIFRKIMSISIPLSVQRHFAEEAKPISYDQASSLLRDPQRQPKEWFELRRQKEPYLTLWKIAIGCKVSPENTDVARLRATIVQKGAPKEVCSEHFQYWKRRLNYEAARVVVS